MSQPPEEGWPTLDEPTLVAPPPPPPAYPPPPDRRLGAGMLLGLAALALVAGGIALAWFLTHRNDNKSATTVVVTTTPPSTATTTPTSTAGTTVAAGRVAVPYLVGLTEQRAVTQLNRAGLRAKAIMRPTKGTRRVLSQKPRAGLEVARGRTVTMVVDQQPQKPIKAPNLVGQPLANAEQKLHALGLHVVTTQVASTQPAGTVVDQAPKPGATLQKGWEVVLSVARQSNTTTGATTTQATTTQATTTQATTTTASTTSPTTTPTPPQPTTATMPDVSNQTEQAAVTAMNRAGILASLFFVPSKDPLGTVEQQAKPSGTKVAYHSHVQINISSGPGQKQQVQVPNVVGRTLRDAVSALNGAGLRLIYVKFPVTSGKVGVVVQQSPLSGAHAPQNAQVLVFLAVKA